MKRSNEIIHEVVSALAEADGVTPEELEYTLAEYIDPGMIETLVSRDVTCKLTFQVPAHEVTVTAAGEVFIDGTESQNGNQPHLADSEQTALSTHPERLRLQRFFDNLPCTVYQSRNEPGWPIEFISGNCRELTGYDPNAFVVGGVNFGFDLIDPDDRERVSETVRESVRNEEPFSLLYRIQTAENAEKWVNEIGVGLFDEKEPIPFVGAIIDVTDMKSDLDIPRDIRV
ncbi:MULTISPECIES: PAS domain-containing protein [Natrialbaceae]|uniref:PAS domain-containing protein n=1 Tax=Natrialbaceae TaxID=1644061 RepID=UPI00207CCAC0|nr:PAS domain-containing protein [Natronococcus sp. CG52]